jgi:CHAD domain-containing protein
MAANTESRARESTTLILPPDGPADRPAAAARDLSPAGRRAARRGRFTRNSPAGVVVLDYLGAQAARLSTLDLAVRRDKPDAVHQMRVTVRRLRSTLQSFTAIVSGPETQSLRAELKWLGGMLGDARDTEVLAAYLHAGLAAVPAELVLGPAQARVTAHFAPLEASSRQALLEALDSPRYRTLVANLNRLLERPPLTGEAAEPAGKVLPRAVAHDIRRTRRRMRRAGRTPAGHDRDVALHEARKSAKRARYAAEVAAPALGQKPGHQARRLVKRVKNVQSVLGDHQDAVLARTAAREIGVHAHLAGENAFSFGLLHERAHHQALASEDRANRAWRRARHASRWLPRP